MGIENQQLVPNKQKHSFCSLLVSYIRGYEMPSDRVQECPSKYEIPCRKNHFSCEFAIATNSHSFISSSCCWDDLYIISKNAQGTVVSNRNGMKFGKNVFHVKMHRLTELSFWFEVIISRWWRHFTQTSAAIWRMHTQHLQHACSSARQFLI